jgi:putative oxygen-independent coproporphyrinogen III oxidase
MSDIAALYIHWPFCVSKCPYCDFNSHVRDSIDHDDWTRSYLTEINYWSDRIGKKKIRSIFFGGGTPSLMPASTVSAMLDEIAARFDVANDVEVTLEANPSSVEQARFQGFRAAGVNRVSLGVQALDDQVLKFLGRPHSADEARTAIATAADIFPRFSFDLIYARPGQTLAAWRQELDRALSLAGSHLSLYQLTIEPGTPFHTLHARGEIVMPDADLSAAFFEETQSRMAEVGLPGYEVSNHAASGQESQHNLTYWRYGDYVGIGPGAHGRITENGVKRATRMHRSPEIWMERVNADRHGLAEDSTVDADKAFDEQVMMGLRLSEGLPSVIAQRLDQTKVQALCDEGLLEWHADKRLRATLRGALVLNRVISYLLT